MVAILLGIDKQAFATCHGCHVVTAVGQVVDGGDNVGFLRVDFLALNGGFGHFALGVVGGLKFLAHGITTASAHEFNALYQLSAWHLQHHKAVIKREHRADDTFGNGALRHIGANTALIHDGTINILDTRKILNDFHGGIAHPVLGSRTGVPHEACTGANRVVHDAVNTMAVLVEPGVHGGVAACCLVPTGIHRNVVINDVARFQIQIVGGHQLAALSILSDGYHFAIGIAHATPITSRFDGRVGV